MEPIELERWGPDPNDPHKMKYIGQPTAVEVFKELEQRLESKGYLPDEYFLMDRAWENGREIPRGADIFCTTDYGSCEGIYIDVYLKWYEDGKPITKGFATGKTLGETGADLDRMFLIASEITKAFHGDRGQYARYDRLGEMEIGGDRIVNLTPAEQKVFIGALLEQRERMLEDTNGVEQLLRRMTGSITEYMDLVGQPPLRISDYDKAVLAIHDGNLGAFIDHCPKALGRADDLLVEAAGRCGEVGRKMVLHLFTDVEWFSETAYMTATQRAVDIGDTQRVRFLMEQAADFVQGLKATYFGEVIDYACGENMAMGRELITQAPYEWIAAAPPSLLLRMTSGHKELCLAQTLIDKGLQPGMYAASVLQNLTCSRGDIWMAESLLKNGMEVGCKDYHALNVCVKNGAVDAAKLLLEQGMDFDGYLDWRGHNDRSSVPKDVMEELGQYAQELKRQGQTTAAEEAPTQEQTFGGLSQ